ncbi:MAG: hypothetical protein KF766_11330 [Rhodocyclaceae bacterium]|nr:hypothetical protein [Rhodocyclaceae bacterium]
MGAEDRRTHEALRVALLVGLTILAPEVAMAQQCKVVGSADEQYAALMEIKEIASIAALRTAVRQYRPFDWKICYPNTSDNASKFPFVYTSAFHAILRATSPQLLDQALTEKLFDANEDVPSMMGTVAGASVPSCRPDAKTYVDCAQDWRYRPLHILANAAAPSFFRSELGELDAPFKIEVFLRHGADHSFELPAFGTPLDSYVSGVAFYRTRDQQPASVSGFIDAAVEAGWKLTHKSLGSSVMGTADLTRAVLKHYRPEKDAEPHSAYALYSAAWAGKLDTAMLLVESGIDPHAKSIKQSDGSMMSPLDAAVIQGKDDVAAYFRSLGAASAPRPAADAMTERQLLDLVASGLSADSILTLVRGKGLAFELDAAAIIRLSREKLPSTLLVELQKLQGSRQ